MLPNLKALGVFAKVAETLSFAATAKALNISAPVVSQHVTQLEQDLDTALVYRSTRALTLTPAGQRLAVRAQDMLDAAETGLEELQTDLRDVSGTLSITVPSFVAAPVFTKLLVAFSEAYPNVRLNLSYSTQIVNLIDSGFDLAIRVGDLKDSNLKARKLMDGHGKVFASPAFLARFPKLTHPKETETLDITWIMPPKLMEPALFHDETGEEYLCDNSRARFFLDNGEAEKQMALIGAGLVVLPPSYVSKEVAEGSLTPILQNWSTVRMGVYAVWPKNAGRRSLTRVFVDFFADALKDFEQSREDYRA